MFSPQRKLKIVALLCSILFAAGLTQLFLLRFESGNIYPAYSSLRSDPLGTRALFDSLDRLSEGTVDRNYRPWRQAGFDAETTMIIIGLRRAAYAIDEKRIEALLNGLAENGGRLIMTFRGRSTQLKGNGGDASASTDDPKDDASADAQADKVFVEEDVDGGDEPGNAALDERYRINPLGITIHVKSGTHVMDDAVRRADHHNLLPFEIPWRSHLYFDAMEEIWETLYYWQQAPVVVQRPWGKGTVVMVADSYLLSNEALRNHRSSGFLAWLAVPGHNIVFDEFHKGLAKQPGIAGLTRQYRLHWVFAALMVVAGLFIWRQVAVFVPSAQSAQGHQAVPVAVGRETGIGMVELSRKHIGTEQLLPVCYQAWKVQAAQRVSPSLIKEIDTMVQQSAATPQKEIQVDTYKQICELIKQGKRL